MSHSPPIRSPHRGAFGGGRRAAGSGGGTAGEARAHRLRNVRPAAYSAHAQVLVHQIARHALSMASVNLAPVAACYFRFPNAAPTIHAQTPKSSDAE